MKAALKIENKASLNGSDELIDRLQGAIAFSNPLVKTWLLAQIEAALSQLPFQQASLQDPETSESPSQDRLLTA